MVVSNYDDVKQHFFNGSIKKRSTPIEIKTGSSWIVQQQGEVLATTRHQ